MLALNLGCGDAYLPKFLNVDLKIIRPPNGQFETFETDLSRHPWPWEDSSVDLIVARDIIEHLPDKIATMNEIWRVLKHGAIAHIEVPTTDGPGAFQDPTHCSYWNRHSFWYFERTNPYRTRFALSYGVDAEFTVENEQHIDTPDGPKLIIRLKAYKESQ